MKPDSFLLKFTCILFFLGLLCAAGMIPFYFESPSMYYKTGIDKLLLRTGKIFGIITVQLMLLQPIFIGRFSWLDTIFTMKKLFLFHRINGMILLGAAVIHPILILGADHFVFFPFESKYWPEITGVFLLLLLILFIVISILQKKIGIKYKTWKITHKTLAPFLFLIMFTHVFNVSRSFESGLPWYLLLAAGVMTISMFIRKSFH